MLKMYIYTQPQQVSINTHTCIQSTLNVFFYWELNTDILRIINIEIKQTNYNSVSFLFKCYCLLLFIEHFWFIYKFCLWASALTSLAFSLHLSLAASTAAPARVPADWLESLATSLLASPDTACVASETFSAT